MPRSGPGGDGEPVGRSRVLLLAMYRLDDVASGPTVRVSAIRHALSERVDLDLVSGTRGERAGALLRYAAGGRLRGLAGVYVESSSIVPGPVDLLFIAWARVRGIPVLTYVRDAYQLFPEYYPATSLKRRLARAAFGPAMRALRRSSTTVAFPSRGLARAVLGEGPAAERAMLLPPGARLPDVAPVDPAARAVLYVGTLGYPASGGAILLEGMRLARERGHDLELICVTPSEDRPPEPHPAWLRTVVASGDQITELLSDVLMTVSPRRQTPYNDLAVPIKVMEYLGYGRPMVVTDTTETAAIVHTAACGVVIPDTVEGIADGIAAVAGAAPAQVAAWGAAARRAAAANAWDKRAESILSTLGVAPGSQRRLAFAAPLTVAAAVGLTLLFIAGSHVSTVVFTGAALGLVVVASVASLAWPRTILVVVALSPILDRYLIPGLLTPAAETLTHFLSEALLVGVGSVLVAKGWRHGTLRAALFHPTVGLAFGFVLLSLTSAVVNGVPAAQAVAGIGFTLDAVALFVLARIVGFTPRQARTAIGWVVGLALLAALVTTAQAVLSPHLLGLSSLQGRYGEVYRLAAFFGDPNTLAAFLSAAIPFTIFGATGLASPSGRRLALAGTALLMLALWLSFSRGGWLGAVGGFTIAALLLDRRALRIGLLLAVVIFAAAMVMPRNLLCDTCDERPDLIGSTFGRVDTIGEGRDLRTLFVLNALPIIGDHPALGVGPGRYGGAAADIFGTPVYARYGTDELFVNPTQRTVDDFWLHLVVESGVVGLGVFAGMVGATVRPMIRCARGASGPRRMMLAGSVGAIAALTINSLTTMLLEANSMAFLFWLLLGIGSLLAVASDPET